MAFLRFIFSSFWVWLGFVVLVCVVGGVVVTVVKTCKHSRKITTYRVGERWYITVEEASKEDVEQAIISAVYAPDGREGNNEQEKGNEACVGRDNQD